MGGEILNEAGLRGLEFEQFRAVLLLGQFLPQFLVLGGGLGALGLQVAPVVGADLAQSLFG